MLPGSMHDQSMSAERAVRTGGMSDLGKKEAPDKIVKAWYQVQRVSFELQYQRALRLPHRLRARRLLKRIAPGRIHQTGVRPDETI